MLFMKMTHQIPGREIAECENIGRGNAREITTVEFVHTHTTNTEHICNRETDRHQSNLYLKKRVTKVSYSSTAYDWTMGRKRLHSNSNQLTDK